MTRQQMARKRASMARTRRRPMVSTAQSRRASASRMRNMASMRNASGAQTGFSKPSGDFANASGNPETEGRVAADILTPFI